MLEREQMWNTWKNDGCKEFGRKPATEAAPAAAAAAAGATADTKAPAATAAAAVAPAKPLKRRAADRRLGDLVADSIAAKRFYMGSPELTRLWNICPDNLQACRGDDRNFLPSIETYLENPKDKTDPSFEWRALRLLARQSPHFFSLTMTPNKVSDYLEGVRKKIQESKTRDTTTTAATAATAAKAATQTPSDAAATKGDTATAPTTAATKAAAAAATVEEVSVVETEAADSVDADNLTAASTAAGHHDDDHNQHKIAIVTDVQRRQVATIIGAAWRKVATKLGYTADVQQFIDDKADAPTAADKCLHMLNIWFDEDDDANLDNLAYMLEGLELVVAAQAIKRMAEPADKMDDVSE